MSETFLRDEYTASENEGVYEEETQPSWDEVESIEEEVGALEFEEYLAKISGKDAEGKPLVTIAYQCYALEDDDNSPAKQVSYNLTTPWIQFWVDKLNPGFVGIDIAFRSFDDTELRMLWGRLNRHIRNMSKEPEKTWIFYVKVIENASLLPQSEEVAMVHFMNPSISFLTRELPTMQASNEASNYGLQGGNVIRMLVPENLVEIEFVPNEELDIDTMRAEVMRDAEDAAYQDAVYYAGDKWDESSSSF